MQDNLVKCHHEYEAQQDDELTIRINDIIKIISKHGDWWEGLNLITEQSGIFPSNFVMPISGPKVQVPEDAEKVIAEYDYEAQAPDELNFFKGDIITVLEKDDGWWKGEKDGRTGVFPANFVLPYEPTESLTENLKPALKETELEPEVELESQNDKESNKRVSISDNFKLAAYGVKKGGLGSLFSGGLGLRKNKSKSTKSPEESPIQSSKQSPFPEEKRTSHISKKSIDTSSAVKESNKKESSPSQKEEIVKSNLDDSPVQLKSSLNDSNQSQESLSNNISTDLRALPSLPQSRQSRELPNTPQNKLPNLPPTPVNTPNIENQSLPAIPGSSILPHRPLPPNPASNKNFSLPPIPKAPSISLDSKNDEKNKVDKPNVEVPPMASSNQSPPQSFKPPSHGIPILPIPGMPRVPQFQPIPKKVTTSETLPEVEHSESPEVEEEFTIKEVIKEKKVSLANVISDYNAQSPGELSLIAGDVLSVLEKGEDFWKGDYHGKIGYFPPNVVEMIDENIPAPEEEEGPAPGKSFKLAAYGVKKGGLGGLFATGGLPQLRRTNTGSSPKPQAVSQAETPIKPKETKSLPSHTDKPKEIQNNEVESNKNDEINNISEPTQDESETTNNFVNPISEIVQINAPPDTKSLPAIVDIESEGFDNAIEFGLPKLSTSHDEPGIMSIPQLNNTMNLPEIKDVVEELDIIDKDEYDDSEQVKTIEKSIDSNPSGHEEVDSEPKEKVEELFEEDEAHEGFDSKVDNVPSSTEFQPPPLPKKPSVSLPYPISPKESDFTPISRTLSNDEHKVSHSRKNTNSSTIKVENIIPQDVNLTKSPESESKSEFKDSEIEELINSLPRVDSDKGTPELEKEEIELEGLKEDSTEIETKEVIGTTDIEIQILDEKPTIYVKENLNEDDKLEAEENQKDEEESTEPQSLKDQDTISIEKESEIIEPSLESTSLKAKLGEAAISPNVKILSLGRPSGSRTPGRRNRNKAEPTLSDTLEKAIKEEEEEIKPEPVKEEESKIESVKETPKGGSLGRHNKMATPFAGLAGPPKLPSKPVLARFNSHTKESESNESNDKPETSSGTTPNRFSNIRNNFTEQLNRPAENRTPIPSLQGKLKDFVQHEVQALKQEFEAKLEQERKARLQLQEQLNAIMLKLNEDNQP